MFDWRHKKNDGTDEPEDFVLMNDDSSVSQEDNSDESNFGTVDEAFSEANFSDDPFNDTRVIPSISDEKPESSDSAEEYVQKNALSAFESDSNSGIDFDIGDDDGFKPASVTEPKSFYEKYKSTIIASGITVAAGIVIAVLIIVISTFSNPLRNYSQVAVTKGNVVNSMNTSGTLSANARYSITSLVSGTIVSSTPEVGDKVTAGTVLYKLDDTEAQLAVKRAENQLARSKSSGSYSSSAGSSKIYATESGTIQSLNIKTGYKLSAGQVIGTIKKADGSITAITTPVSGTVSAVNSGVGKTVAAGGLLATLSDGETQSSASTRTYDQKSNEYDVESAKKQLENYTIKSPVSGIVTEKNAKVGDNVGITNLDNPMMVIVDMNSLKFTFQVDEYKVWEMEAGQDVIVNADSLPDETFAGKITNVSSEGYKNDDDQTVFDVEVTVEEPGHLKSGMNVSAKVIMQSATNVMYLPKNALIEPDGKHALVLVKEDTVSDTSSSETLSPSEVPKDATDEQLSFTAVKVPKGCKLVTVSYGISDDTNVEITSGIKVGDIVVYDPKNDVPDLKPAATSTPANTDSVKQPKATDDTAVPDSTPAPTATEAKQNEVAL